MELIDTHTHLFLPEFEGDIAEVMTRAQLAGVTRFLFPNIDRLSIDPMLKLTDRYPGQCFPMIGLHPTSVLDNYRQELSHIHGWIGKRKFYGIGETGIDLYWDTTYKTQQIDAFEEQIGWAVKYNLPLVIHSRNSMDLILDLLKPYAGSGLKGVFHCFTGTYEQACRIFDLGFMLGIGGVATYKNGGVNQVLPRIGVDRIMLETDSPYLPPVPYRGKRNESAFLIHTLEFVSSLLGIPSVELARITTQNAVRMFALKTENYES